MAAYSADRRETLIQLYNARDRQKALLYELTGISDIMRGMTEPDETLGAQKLKSNFSTRRVTPQQKKVGKFARNALRLMAAVITEHFSAKTISLMTGYPQLDPVPPLPPRPMPPLQPPQPLMIAGPQNPSVPPQAQAPPAGAPAQGAAVPGGAPTPPQAPPNPAMQAYQQQMAQWTQLAQQAAQVQQANQKKQQEFDAAYQLIKQDGIHGFRIDIEADSTAIAIDEAEDQENRAEFLRNFVPLMQQMVPVAQGNPAMANLAKDLVLFGMRGFREARTLEETISTAFDTLAKMPPPQQKGADGPDSPADLAIRGQQVKADMDKTNVQLQIAREKNAIEMAKLGQESHDSAAKLAADESKGRVDAAMAFSRDANEAAFRNSRANALDSRSASRLS